MDWEKYLYPENEKPLDNLVQGYSNTSIFRKIAFVGDSLSSGEFETVNKNGDSGFYDMFEYSFGQYIARANGLTAYKFSRGGMTAREYMEGYAEEKGFWDKEKAAQAYVVALGVNDLVFAKMELGSVEDIDISDYKNNKPTFTGYYAAIIQRYKEIAPDAKFFFVTIAKSDFTNFEAKAEEHRRILYELAEFFDNAYVIDLYKYGPPHDKRFIEKFFMYGHMNPMGYLHTAKVLDSYIDYIIRTNPKDFEYVGFINTGIDYN